MKESEWKGSKDPEKNNLTVDETHWFRNGECIDRTGFIINLINTAHCATHCVAKCRSSLNSKVFWMKATLKEEKRKKCSDAELEGMLFNKTKILLFCWRNDGSGASLRPGKSFYFLTDWSQIHLHQTSPRSLLFCTTICKCAHRNRVRITWLYNNLSFITFQFVKITIHNYDVLHLTCHVICAWVAVKSSLACVCAC